MKPIRIVAMLFVVLCGWSQVWAGGFRTVVIDAGHGGHDRGAAWGKVYEKHLALDTAVRLESHLKRLGYRTVMTRRDDYYLTLPQRAAIANQYKDAIFVSVHFNHTWREGASGLETFYYGAEGQKLAAHVQRGMVKRTKTLDREAKFARFFVLRNCRNPAVLVEGGFVSNERERERMRSGDFREDLARGIAEGIERYRRGL